MNLIPQLRLQGPHNRKSSRYLILGRKGEKLLMCVGVPLANSCFLLFCEKVGGYRNVELARWALMDVPEGQVPKKVGNGQKDGPSLRKSALLGRATRGHPGNMTGDKDNYPARLYKFAFSSSKGQDPED